MENRVIKAFLILFALISYGCVNSSPPPLEKALNKAFPNGNNEELANNINFPAQIALLAYSQKNTEATTSNSDWLAKLAESADQKGKFSNLNITKEQAKGELDNIFVIRNCPEKSLDRDEIRGKLIELAIDEGLKNFGVSPTEAREAVTLIKSGQFYRDISSSVVTVAKVLPSLANKLIINPPKLSKIFHKSSAVILNDFRDNPSAIECIKKLKNHKSCDKPKVLQHTLKALYESPTIDVTKETMGVLLEKESIRLAIILYARSNGIDVEKEDIDAFQIVLAETDPELGKFFNIAIIRMVKKYGPDEAKMKLNTMGSNTHCNAHP